MARPCSVCVHAKRKAIDTALLAGESFRVLSQKFRLSTDALRRHQMANHIPQAMAKAQEAQEVARGDSLLDTLATLTADATRIQEGAEKKGNYQAALGAIRERTRLVELTAKMRGELESGVKIQVAILAAPEWLSLRGIILAALEPFPEARQSVIRAIAHE
ncbi:MAG: hypothetical protein HQL87_09535 [Magnetococcales bacterium]|nr:hypothetical protein [Magnetococcales bacterium]